MRLQKEDQAWMNLAIQEALKGNAEVLPNPRVGAVYVKNGKLISKGWHQKLGEAHAEVNAAKNSEDIIDSTLYVTLEPCLHKGKTPPCTEFIIKNKVKRVVFGQSDPSHGGGAKVMEQNGIEVFGPIEHPHFFPLTEAFCKNHLQKKTYFHLKWAMTMDGKIATHRGDSKWISSDASRQYAHHLRSLNDGIMVGAGTVLSDFPRLTLRNGVIGPSPRPIVFDPKGKTIQMKEWWEEKASFRPVLVTSSGVNVENIKGCDILICDDYSTLDRELFELGIYSVLIEGGQGMHGVCMDHQLADRVAVFISPKISGGKNSYTPIGGKGVNLIKDSHMLKYGAWKKIDEDMCFEGWVKLHHPSATKDR